MAIGIADIKSFVMQIIVLMSRHKGIDTVRRSIAVVILWLDLMLFITVIRVYLLPNKCELVKEEERDKYFKKARNWNRFITLLSVLIFVVEIVGESLEKDGIIGGFIKQFYS